MSDEIRMTLLHHSTNDLIEELLMWRGLAAEHLDRISELEAENDRLQSGWFRDETICPDGSLRPKVSALLERIAELEGKIDKLAAHDATERQDDKWIPEVQE